jgi:succinoglycan biosynthesis protein ExoA
LDKQPTVSVIIPCYNEERTIAEVLQGIYDQDYPRDRMTVILADGMSTDNTRDEIAKWKAAHTDLAVQVIDNPKRHIPAALNTAFGAAEGEMIVRLDAHSVPCPEYVRLSVEGLLDDKNGNVGGIWIIHPGREGWVAKSIAAAVSHPIGVGGARYRYTRTAQVVDTVPFGSFRRDFLLDIIADLDRDVLFDESLPANEDYEVNVIIRQRGKQIWLDPRIQNRYYARPSYGSLKTQYIRYGFWKLQMLTRYPESLRWRQFLPPAFVFSLIVLACCATVSALALGVLLAEVAAYGLVLGAAGLQLAIRKKSPSMIIGVPIAIGLMHICWGGAFLTSLVRYALGFRPLKKASAA